MVWIVVAIVLVALLAAAYVYDRRHNPRVRPGSGSREQDHGEGLYRGGLGAGQNQGEGGGLGF